MNSLFDINQTYINIISELEENGGESTPELDQALQINREELQLKVTNYKWVIDKILGDITLANNEKARLDDFVESKEKLITQLEKKLLQATLLFGAENPTSKVKTLHCGTLTLSTRKSSSIEISSIGDVPKEYKVVDVVVPNMDVDLAEGLTKVLKAKNITFKEVIKPVKAIIDKAIKDGTEVAGATKVEQVNLVIK